MIPAWGFVLALLCSAGIAGAFAAYAAMRRREAGVDWFIALLALQSVWTLLVVAGAVLPIEYAAAVEVALLWLGSVMSVAWLGFILAYTGRGTLSLARVAGLLAFPAVSLPVLAANPGGVAVRDATTYTDHGLAVAELTMGPWGTGVLVFIFALFLAGLVVLVWHLLSSSVEIAQTLALLTGASACIVTGLLVSLGVLSKIPVNPTPFAFPLSALTFGYALFSHELLSVSPATRRIGEQSALDDLEEGVVVLNAADEIVRINPAAEAVLHCADREVRGVPLRDVVGDAFPALSALPASYSTDDRRRIDVSSSPVTDDFGRSIGRTLLCRDVTTVEQHRQRLQVLQRLLRHNLRNELNVVEGQANLLEREVPEVTAHRISRIKESTGDLLSVADKMRRIEELAPGTEPDLIDTDVGGVLDAVVETIRADSPETELSLSVSGDVRIRTDPDVLEDVVVELVGNAIEHGGDEVRIVVDDRGDGVEIAIEDDGCGIPEQDRQAILDGRETSLRHASGVGLWLVKWGARRLDATLSFECEDCDGTTVVLRVPTRRPDVSSRPDAAAAQSDAAAGDRDAGSNALHGEQSQG